MQVGLCHQLKAFREKAEAPKKKRILPPGCFWTQLQHQLLTESPACDPTLQIWTFQPPQSWGQFLGQLDLPLFLHIHPTGSVSLRTLTSIDSIFSEVMC